ncbi:MAG: hypothetical protein FWG70_08640 [Oscillospiraceae bacterium]|nr:hypothetical protein [Oscillospiraceae bacterium]
MKKCPRCLKYDHDDIRFCRYCNTELFFPERFSQNADTEKREFKTTKGAMISRFVVLLLLFLSIGAVIALVVGEQKDVEMHLIDYSKVFTLPVILIIGAGALFLSGYFAFYRRNIKITVSDRGVSFFRGSEIQSFLNFSSEKYTFGSYVVKHTTNSIIPSGNDKFLRVFNKSDGKHKDYKCNFLTKKAFEEMISCADSIGVIPVPAKTEDSDSHNIKHDDKPSVFYVNKNIMKKKMSSELIMWSVIIGIVAVFSVFYIEVQGYPWFFSVPVLLILSLPVIIYAVVKPRKEIKNMPQKITLYHDRIVMDETPFYFNKLKQVKATPPSYQDDGKGVPSLFHTARKIIFIENNKTTSYIVGRVSDKDSKKPPVFADYEILCNELRGLFVNEPDKFLWELV